MVLETEGCVIGQDTFGQFVGSGFTVGRDRGVWFVADVRFSGVVIRERTCRGNRVSPADVSPREQYRDVVVCERIYCTN